MLAGCAPHKSSPHHFLEDRLSLQVVSTMPYLRCARACCRCPSQEFTTSMSRPLSTLEPNHLQVTIQGDSVLFSVSGVHELDFLEANTHEQELTDKGIRKTLAHSNLVHTHPSLTWELRLTQHKQARTQAYRHRSTPLTHTWSKWPHGVHCGSPQLHPTQPFHGLHQHTLLGRWSP